MAVLLMAPLLVGCGPDYDAICQEVVDCAGGNEADLEACIREAERQEEIADIEGCGDEWEEMIVCIEEEASCESTPTGMACTTTDECRDMGIGICGAGGECVFKAYGLKDSDDCEQETRAYGRCDDYGSGGVDHND